MRSTNVFEKCSVKHRGFSLFELILVLVVVMAIAIAGLIYYENAMEETRRTRVEILANRFTAAIALIRAQWVVESTVRDQGDPHPKWRVDVDNIPIFVNEFGWPANTDGGSNQTADQTAEECHQIWSGVLQNPPLAIIGDGGPNEKKLASNMGKQRYKILVIDDFICRYELITDPKGTHAFEYDLRTGRVLTKVPVLE